jgi:hypothetical protein
LAERVVDFVSASVVEILTFKVNLRARTVSSVEEESKR